MHYTHWSLQTLIFSANFDLVLVLVLRLNTPFTFSPVLVFRNCFSLVQSSRLNIKIFQSQSQSQSFSLSLLVLAFQVKDNHTTMNQSLSSAVCYSVRAKSMCLALILLHSCMPVLHFTSISLRIQIQSQSQSKTKHTVYHQSCFSLLKLFQSSLVD